jgi:hypothetical protein
MMAAWLLPAVCFEGTFPLTHSAQPFFNFDDIYDLRNGLLWLLPFEKAYGLQLIYFAYHEEDDTYSLMVSEKGRIEIGDLTIFEGYTAHQPAFEAMMATKRWEAT